MNSVSIQTQDFDTAAECTALTTARQDVGALVAFTGQVRADDGLTALTLEHYPAMTAREIARHVAEAERRWPLLGIRIVHRIGRLLPGERIVLVAVAAAHREPAFRAAEFLMDYLKTRAPFWKQEQRGAATRWIEARHEDETSVKKWA